MNAFTKISASQSPWYYLPYIFYVYFIEPIFVGFFWFGIEIAWVPYTEVSQLDKQQLALILIKENHYKFFLKLLVCQGHTIIYKPYQNFPFNEMNWKLMHSGRKIF